MSSEAKRQQSIEKLSDLLEKFPGRETQTTATYFMRTATALMDAGASEEARP